MKAGSDGTMRGTHLPEMVFWPKGVTFIVTSMGTNRQKLCPGRWFPFLLCSPEEQTPARLRIFWCPPRYSKLASQNPEYNTDGLDVFVKLDNLERLLKTLKVSGAYLTSSLLEEVDEAST
ncbi:hypothetical protein A6R68_04715, partial [Neotoma lepida]